MNEEKKQSQSTEEGSCCAPKKCCGGKKVCCLLIGVLLAGAGFGLYQAGKCAGRSCAVPVAADVQK